MGIPFAWINNWTSIKKDKEACIMKKFPFLRKIYWSLYWGSWKALAIINPKLATKLRYKKCLGYYPNLSEPKTLNEKLQYLKLYVYKGNPLVKKCTDKYEVRNYVKEKGCADILNELFYVYDNVDQIEFDKLPNSFVLKCNHGSGGNIICRDKTEINFDDCKSKLKKWMKTDFGLERVEYSYEGIKRKILCEKLIDTDDGLPPKDYKFFCSYGEPKLIFVACDRYEGKTKFDYYTPEWEWINVRNGHPNAGPIPKPHMFDKMKEYASTLSKDFPLVRVDLYCENNRIIFGELTFLHFGGVTPFEPKEFDLKFGNLFPIENILKMKKGK